jgi:putative N6-adenine-specific DNA methylase
VEENMDLLYAMIGERLKHHFAGNTAWILTSSKEYLKNVGLKPGNKITCTMGHWNAPM